MVITDKYEGCWVVFLLMLRFSKGRALLLWQSSSPVECVRVQVQDLQGSGIRFIRQLMNQQPLFILSYYANLEDSSKTSAAQQISRRRGQQHEENRSVLLKFKQPSSILPGPPQPNGKWKSCRRNQV